MSDDNKKGLIEDPSIEELNLKLIKLSNESIQDEELKKEIENLKKEKQGMIMKDFTPETFKFFIDELQRDRDKMYGSLFGVDGKSGRLDIIDQTLSKNAEVMSKIIDKVNEVNATLNNGLKDSMKDIRKRVETIEKKMEQYVKIEDYEGDEQRKIYIRDRRKKDKNFLITAMIAAISSLAAVGTIIISLL